VKYISPRGERLALKDGECEDSPGRAFRCGGIGIRKRIYEYTLHPFPNISRFSLRERTFSRISRRAIDGHCVSPANWHASIAQTKSAVCVPY